jgi:hypothetical protein
MHRTLFTLAALTAVACSEGGKDTAEDPTAPTGGVTSTVPVAEAPDPYLAVSVHDDSGALLQDLEMPVASTWSGNYASGVLNIAVVDTATSTQFTFTAWEPIAAGTSWPIVAFEDGSLPSDATLVYVEGAAGGGAAVSGTFTLSGWQPTDSPQLFLASGTFDALVLNPDDPTWTRDLRDGVFDSIKVTSMGY